MSYPFGVLYNRRFILCSDVLELFHHWDYAKEHHFMVQAFIFNSGSNTFERLSSSMLKIMRGA